MKNPIVIAASKFGPMMVNINDTYVGREIIRYGAWAPGDITLIIELLTKRMEVSSKLVFYDVGANIGTHSVAVSKAFDANVMIRAFEAQRQIFYMLCGNVALNNLTNIFCHHNAVSNDTADISYYAPDYNAPNNFGGTELIPPVRSDNLDLIRGSCDSVTSVRLEAFNENVDFLKVDVEGMEDKVLQGAERIFATSRPIAFVEVVKTDVKFVFEFFGDLHYIALKKDVDVLFLPQEQFSLYRQTLVSFDVWT